MEIALPPEIERYITEKVESGKYESASAMVANAVSMLREDEIGVDEDIERLRAEVAVGVEQAKRGDVAPLDMRTIRARVFGSNAPGSGGT